MESNHTATEEVVAEMKAAGKPTPLTFKDLPLELQKQVEAQLLSEHNRNAIPISDRTRRISINQQNPMMLAPNGDRYLVELLEIEDNAVITGADGKLIKILIPEEIPGKYDPKTGDAEPTMHRELLRGWRAGLVLRVGNGHRLEVPDNFAVIPGATSKEDMEAVQRGEMQAPQGVMHMTEQAVVVPVWSTVPMFYAAGDIILIDRLCGREVVLGAKNKKYVLVNQVDVLCKFEGVTLADIEVE